MNTMESHVDTETPNHDNPLMMLARRLVYQIHLIIVCREKNVREELLQSIKLLKEIEFHNAYALLLICKDWDSNERDCDDTSWRYAQVMASMNDNVVIESYFDLLDSLCQQGIPRRSLFELLTLPGRDGSMLGSKMGVEIKLLLLNFLLHLHQSSSEDDYVSLNMIQDLLATSYDGKASFLSDMMNVMINKTVPDRKPYYALLYFMINHDLIHLDHYEQFIRFEAKIVRHIVQFLCGDEQEQALINALDHTHLLGQFFLFNRGSDDTYSLKQLRNVLKQIQTRKQEKQKSEEVTDDEIKRSEVNFMRPSKKNKLQQWWCGSFGGFAKPVSKKTEKEEMDNMIPMQTLTN